MIFKLTWHPYAVCSKASSSRRKLQEPDISLGLADAAPPPILDLLTGRRGSSFEATPFQSVDVSLSVRKVLCRRRILACSSTTAPYSLLRGSLCSPFFASRRFMAEGGVIPPQEPSQNGNDTSTTTTPTTTTTLQFLETPEGRRLAYRKLEGSSPGVVFIHGLNSDMNGTKAVALEQVCKRQGSAYVRFDLSGHGQSSMDFNLCNITVWLEDLNSVLSSLTKGPQVLVGSSLGGWLMFLCTMRNPDNIFGLIGVGVAPDFTQRLWKQLSAEGKQEVKKAGVYRLETPYSTESYEVTLQLIQDGDKYSIMDMPGVEYVKSPVRLFHGEQDTVVPPSTVLKLMQKLQCPVSLKTVQDGDHRLSRPQDIELIGCALAELLNPRQGEDYGADSTDQDQDD